MGGGSSAPTESQVTQTNLPEYAEPYMTRLLDRTESESLRPYTPYEGPRLAETAPETWLARDMVMGIQGIGGLDQAYDATMAGAQGAQDMLNWQGGTYDQFEGSQYGYQDPSMWNTDRASDYVDPYITNFTGPEANRYGFNDVDLFTPEAASQYMSPYMQNVVDVQKDQAQLDFERAQSGRDATKVNQGAFGGTRGAVVDALAQEDLATRMGEIQAMGQQSAYEDAQNMFGADREALMRRELERAGENSRVDEFGRVVSGMEADIRTGGYDLAGRLFGDDRSAGMMDEERRAAELARYEQLMQGESQYGGDLDFQREQLEADLLARGSGLSADIGDSILGLGQAERDALLQDAQLREQIGADIEGEDQRALDLSYEDYLRQINYPTDQLNMYSSILRGMPITPDTSTTFYQNRNPYQDAIGAGISALGLYKGLS